MLWEQGCTVDEIALRTRIPRSTIGYYVRKFNKSAEKGKPIVLPQIATTPKSQAETVESASWKIEFLNLIYTFDKQGKIVDLYHFFSILKILKETFDVQIFFTSEEKQVLGEALASYLKRIVSETRQ